MKRAGALQRLCAIVMAAGALATLTGELGCEGKQRPFAAAGPFESDLPLQPNGPTPPEAPNGATPSTTVVLGALGSVCAIDSGCSSGVCVSGVCCDRACDGLCEACTADGRCAPILADDPQCPVIDCQATANSCATYPATQSINRCDGNGGCKTTCDPLTVAVDTACGEVAPGIQGRCDASGRCVDPRAGFGAACQSDIDCAAGTCVDGVCCREACAGACESCGINGECTADAAGTSCGDGLQCAGRGLCLAPAGSVCQAGSDCTSGNCMAAVGGGTACCTEACAGGLLCNGDGVCVSPESDLGAVCTIDTDCLGGRCFDGVCCDSECGGACERCNAPGQEGRCSAEPPGTTDAACPPNTECAGRGECLRPLGANCTLNGDCRSGECGLALEGSGEICCEATCLNGQRCSPAGSCVDAPRPDGSACVAGTDCLSGSCVAGRCCESECDGVCQACSGLGDCNVSPGNDIRCPPVDCPTSTTICVSYPPDVSANLCAAFGSCRSAEQDCRPTFAPAGTPCEPLAPGVTGTCDGTGTCRDPRVGLGVTCNADEQCTSGNCSPRAGGGTICCDTPCDGLCEACGANGACAFRDNGLCPPGQQCSANATCEPLSVAEGSSCAGGQACSGGAVCVQGICRGLCTLVADNATSGSRYDQCVLAP